MNENREEPVEEQNHVQASFLVGADQIEKGFPDAGKWYGIFKLDKEGVAFVSDDVWDTKDEALAWAAEAGQSMLFKSLLGLVANQTLHWND